MKIIEMKCAKCDSTDVRQDAWAVWNVKDQCWELGDTFDQAYCENCGGEAELYECETEMVE